MPERTALYVEDDDLVARSILRMPDLGVRLEHVSNVEQARAWIDSRAEPPVAVLVDEGLPDGNGAALARELRDRGLAAGVVSGRQPSADEPVPWLTKPFSRGQLRAFIALLAG